MGTQTDLAVLQALRQRLAAVPDLQFAVLVGSRAQGVANSGSDWDIALKWLPQKDGMQLIGLEENLRRQLAQMLDVSSDQIDLINLSRANLAMRANVAEEGIVLHGEESLAWIHFLNRTWRELEDFYWEQTHAA
jgi:predicted nucleotidyltransferase